MRLVLPTLWSPSKTIFVRFGGAEEKSAAVGVAGVDMAARGKHEKASCVVCAQEVRGHVAAGKQSEAARGNEFQTTPQP